MVIVAFLSTDDMFSTFYASLSRKRLGRVTVKFDVVTVLLALVCERRDHLHTVVGAHSVNDRVLLDEVLHLRGVVHVDLFDLRLRVGVGVI